MGIVEIEVKGGPLQGSRPWSPVESVSYDVLSTEDVLLLECICSVRVCVFIWVMTLSFCKQKKRQRPLIFPPSYV